MTVGTSPVAPDDEDAFLAERYGRGPSDRRRNRWWFAATAVAFALALGAWLWWGALLSPNAQLEARNAGYSNIGADAIEVRWSLTVEPGTAAKCAVQALDGRYGVVGWKVVDVPPSEQRTRVLTERLQTIGPAETGLIYRCWLA